MRNPYKPYIGLLFLMLLMGSNTVILAENKANEPYHPSNGAFIQSVYEKSPKIISAPMPAEKVVTLSHIEKEEDNLQLPVMKTTASEVQAVPNSPFIKQAKPDNSTSRKLPSFAKLFVSKGEPEIMYETVQVFPGFNTGKSNTPPAKPTLLNEVVNTTALPPTSPPAPVIPQATELSKDEPLGQSVEMPSNQPQNLPPISMFTMESAGRWVNIARDAHSAKSYFIDRESRVGDTFWVRVIDNGIQQAPTKMVAQCYYRTLNGQDIPPESVAEKIYNYVCKDYPSR